MTKLAVALIALLAGGWMLFDGIHVIARGKYFGPEKPGPWSAPFAAIGVDPFRLGPLFIALGLAWLICDAGLSFSQSWAWYGTAVIAFASLWYFPLGTVLSLVVQTLLWMGRRSLLPA